MTFSFNEELEGVLRAKWVISDLQQNFDIIFMYTGYIERDSPL